MSDTTWTIEQDDETGESVVRRPDGTEYGRTKTRSGARKMMARGIAAEQRPAPRIIEDDMPETADAARAALAATIEALRDPEAAGIELPTEDEVTVSETTERPVEEFDVIRPSQRTEIEEAGARYQQQLADLHHDDGRDEESADIEDEQNILEREELELLWSCEDEIRHGMAAYLRVAEALHIIQTKRLYREDFRTFADYCRAKWNLTDRHARNMANAWEIALDLSDDPIANAESLPANERQARELKQVDRERRAEVWEAAVGHAGGIQHVCAHDVKWARQELIERPAAQAAAEAAAMANPEQAVENEPELAPLVERETEVIVTDRDPINHAHRLINKYGSAYAATLADEILNILTVKGQLPPQQS